MDRSVVKTQEPEIQGMLKILFDQYQIKYKTLAPGGIAKALASKLNYYNPRQDSTWSDKYIMQLINGDLPISRYISVAIKILYDKDILNSVDKSKYIGIYCGPLDGHERDLINSLTPEQRKEALKSAASTKKDV